MQKCVYIYAYMYVNIIVDIHIAPCENGIEHLSSFKKKKPFDDHDAGVDH